MAVNQVGVGGPQNVNLYRQNQEKNSLPVQDSERRSEPVDREKNFTVDLSQESVRLSQKGQVQGVEETTEPQVEKPTEQQVRQTEDNEQNNGTIAPQQEKIDLFA